MSNEMPPARVSHPPPWLGAYKSLREMGAPSRSTLNCLSQVGNTEIQYLQREPTPSKILHSFTKDLLTILC